MKAYIVRHGQTEWNKINRWQGNIDIPLDKTGLSQAERLAKKLRKLHIRKIYTSPLTRAYETATIIQTAIGADIVLHEQLTEIDIGEWAGLTLDEMKNIYGALYDKWHMNEDASVGFGVENYMSLKTRAYNALVEICEKEDDDVLIVTHGTLMRALICKLLHIPPDCRDTFEVSNTGVTIVDYNKSNQQFTVVSVNAIL